MSTETRTFVVPEGSSNGSNQLLAILPALLQRQGVDPSILALCNRSGNDGNNNNGWGNDLFAILLLFILMGGRWGQNGLGNQGGMMGNGQGGVVPMLNNDANTAVIMQAVQRNGFDIASLATALNTSSDAITASINALSSQLCNVATQNAQSVQQILMQMMNGNNAITSQICSCCCDLKSLICDQTNTLQNGQNFINRSIERGFADLGYATRDQTCSIEKSIASSTEAILAGQRAAEMREMQRELAERDRKIAEQAVIINNGQQTAIFGQMINQAVAPLVAGQQALSSEVAGIKCRLPETVTIPNPQHFIPVNACVNVPFSFGYGGYNNGGCFGGYNNGGCCG